MEHPALSFFAHGERGWEWNLVHETAHQWWYSVVGNDVQMEPWLDEAFAEYSPFIYFEEVHGEDAAQIAFFRNVEKEYEMGLESGRISRDDPVGQSVYDFPEADASYFWIVCGKGALFLDALRSKAGDEAFFAILQEYYRRYKLWSSHRRGFPGGC